MTRKLTIFALGLAMAAGLAAQQTGSVSGTVLDPTGAPLPGVTVEASADLLPRARVVVTSASGAYRLPGLPPGNYQLSFSLDGMETQTVDVEVLLQEQSTADIAMQVEGVAETISVVAESLVDTSSAELKSSVGSEVIDALPVGQEYQDLVKLIPGVQYTENEVRGPSAGGSGQDNVYQVDGVSVNLPLFGTLSSEPSSHDIDQVSVVKGGAKATEFNRSGGFTINTLSKSGTNDFHGQVSYQVQTDGMTGNLDTGSVAEFDEDRDWTVFSLGGPLVRENLYFYSSYYSPTRSRDNASNAYGEVPDFDDDRDEFFGKLTFTPTNNLLLNGSYRDSDRTQTGTGVGAFETASRGEQADVTLDIATVEGSWIIDEASYVDFKFTDYGNENSAGPETRFDFPVSVGAGGTVLDVNNLAQQGSFGVPTPVFCGGDPTCLAVANGLIQQYGFLEGGVPTGGGFVGADDEINIQDFFRESYQVSYNRIFGGDSNVNHELHVGYQSYEDTEELNRTSNGWGTIEFLGGVLGEDAPEGAFYQATLQQAGTAGFPAGTIESVYESQNIEVNDTIRWQDWTFNVGLLASNDELFGQGLRPNSSNLSGFELAAFHPYQMYEIDWSDTISPRLGAIWAYNGRDTLFANYARYYPAASSLPRAASWARNTTGQVIEVFFDAAGNQLESRQLGGSSGKFFQEDMDPRSIDEFLVGSARQINDKWTARAHGRYRYAHNFWEDTNNNARSRLLAPPSHSQEDYIPELDDFRAEIGGSSYVIAELDFGFTKYYEASFEAEYRSGPAYVRGSYVWSHYYGNFDQDNTSATNNDFNAFVGSSFIADFAGRQLWNDKYGNLRGDRRHQLKLYGYYQLPWDANVGAYAIYQSGEPWEFLNPDYYRCLDPVAADNDENCNVGGTGSSSSSYRYGSCLDPSSGGDGTGVCPFPRAEPAGNRTSDSHHQLDLNYTQNFPLGERYNIQLRGDVFNVFDNQTGYNIERDERVAGAGEPINFYRPRRFQLAVKFQF